MKCPELMIGTGNAQKVTYFRSLLREYEVTVTGTPETLPAPEENGTTAMENARIKAAFYGQYAENVLCVDAGLMFLSLPEDDPRQPGLEVRRPNGIRLDDEEMIVYWADRVRALGGRVEAAFVDGFALKTPEGIFPFKPTMEELKESSFYLTDTPVSERRPGWPLDSLSYDQNGQSYLHRVFNETPLYRSYNPRLLQFLQERLGLRKKNAFPES